MWWYNRGIICAINHHMKNAIIVATLLFLGACTRPENAPQFIGIENIEVSKIMGTNAVLKAEAIFYNPNDVKMKLRKVNIDIELEGKKIGVINQEFTTKVPALSEFRVPLNASFDITEIGLLNGIISILGGKKVVVHYKGFVKVSVHGYPATVPIDFEEEVRM
ncbi:conserved hypothetical protein [Marinoscillum sp. 108]|nr:conserved hypothetical protein [Marinoscillum sp. 108]